MRSVAKVIRTIIKSGKGASTMRWLILEVESLMLTADYTNRYKKDYKLVIKRNYDISLIDTDIWCSENIKFSMLIYGGSNGYFHCYL